MWAALGRPGQPLVPVAVLSYVAHVRWGWPPWDFEDVLLELQRSAVVIHSGCLEFRPGGPFDVPKVKLFDALTP